MDPELHKLLDRLTERRVAAWRALYASGSLPLTFGERRAVPLREGDRVFDPVSGEEGIIAGRTTQNLVVPAPAKRDG